jgi:hypothetical protein
MTGDVAHARYRLRTRLVAELSDISNAQRIVTEPKY